MTKVYLGIGSNIEREKHIVAALDALAERFGRLQLSPVYESEAVGFAGDPFFNLVVGMDTNVPVAELARLLRDIEHSNGRVRSGERFGGRTLDIDILTYGAAVGVVNGVLLPREEILQNAFVLLPLAELAPDELHPVSGVSYAALWRRYDKPQRLWPVDFSWRGQWISREAAA